MEGLVPGHCIDIRGDFQKFSLRNQLKIKGYANFYNFPEKFEEKYIELFAKIWPVIRKILKDNIITFEGSRMSSDPGPDSGELLLLVLNFSYFY